MTKDRRSLASKARRISRYEAQFKTPTPDIVEVDGEKVRLTQADLPQRRKNESRSSFLARIKDWEKFTGKRYPGSKLNRIRLRSPEGGIDYANSPDWRDEKREWVNMEGLEKSLDPTLTEDERKEFFLESAGSTDYSKVDTTPLNADELKIAQAKQKQNEAKLEQSTNVEGTGTGDNQAAVTDISQDGPPPDTAKTIQEVADKQAKDELRIKSDVFTIDPKTKKMVGVLTNSQRRAFEAREDVRASLLKAQTAGNVRRYTNRDKLIRIGGG